MIILENERKSIKIQVSGKGSNFLLELILDGFRSIHFEYGEMNYQTLIPCNCETCSSSKIPHFFNYILIKKILETKIDKVLCENTIAMIPIKPMIKEIESYKKKMQPEFKGFNLLDKKTIDKMNYSKDLIKNGYTSKAIQMVLSITKNTFEKFRKTIEALEIRNHAIRLMLQDEDKIERNKINMHLLDIIDEIPMQIRLKKKWDKEQTQTEE